jgi:hypothetical protein
VSQRQRSARSVNCHWSFNCNYWRGGSAHSEGFLALKNELALALLSLCSLPPGWQEARGRDALGYYERKDERRDIGLSPEHDWSSHAAEAFGLMAVCAEEPGVTRAFNRQIHHPRTGIV